jgi:hypothetical protein
VRGKEGEGGGKKDGRGGGAITFLVGFSIKLVAGASNLLETAVDMRVGL